MALDKQVYIYSVDTGGFYLPDERVKVNEKYKLKQQTGRKKGSKKLQDEIKSLMDSNINIIRTLDPKSLSIKNKVSLFESVLTRTLGLKTKSTSEDIMIVQTFYESIHDSLMNNGFLCNGKEYVDFTSSAGQTRNKKVVYMKKDVWERVKLSLMCGLTEEIINEKDGMSINKYLAYLALCASATDPWDKFNIDKAIVVDDFETEIETEVDFVDDVKYTIERKNMKVPINHTDGCGMMLPKVNKKAFMVRLPWVKGLLVPFPFDQYLKDKNKSKVIDIYGKEYDIFEDGIEIIFTKSQFKMWKYYDSWDEYKMLYKLHKCQAGMTNIEEDDISGARLCYQMLQTLTDLTDEEIESLVTITKNEIQSMVDNPEEMLRLLGAIGGAKFKKKNNLQQALYIYPELLLDPHTKQAVKDAKASLLRRAYSGKIKVKGRYTFVAPDLYAFCEWLFNGIENPNGLLKNGEVSCNLFDDGVKVDCLRSPHLYLEHAVRKNHISEDTSKWFISGSIHTSIHDPISKILMFDCDGDKLTVSNDETLIKAAERNIQGIVPLYYEMKKAEPEQISKQSKAENLKRAFKANIGEISNDITKIWNSEDVNIDLIKLRTMENNFEIDSAKTGYRPTRPEHIAEKFKPYTNNNMKMPYFFRHSKYRLSAQDRKKKKEPRKTQPWTETTVNRLKDFFPDVRIKFKTVKDMYDFDYTRLMKNQPKGGELDQKILERYITLNDEKWKTPPKRESKDGMTSADRWPLYEHIRHELLKVCDDPYYVTDILVDYLFRESNTPYKTTLWSSFGDIIVDNLKNNFPDRVKLCGNGKCRTVLEGKGNARKYCVECATEIRKEKVKNNVKNLRVKNNKHM